MEVPKIGEIIKFSGYDWRVLDIQNDQALLLSELVFEHRAYNNAQEIFKPIDITWEESTLRKYLNEDFYNKLTDKDRIVKTTLQNNNNPWFATSGGNNTTDNIFLLSIEEVVKYLGDGNLARPKMNEDEKQFWEKESRTKDGVLNRVKKLLYPDYSMVIDWDGNSKRVAKDTNGTATWWWLRSLGEDSCNAAHVFENGCVLMRGFYTSLSMGVRPALWINLPGFDKIDIKPQQKKQPPKPTPPLKSKISAKVGEIIEFSGYDWRVLDIQNDQALLLSELALEARAYNNKQTAITWENCTLRKYLNNDFYNKLTDRDKIVKRTIPNKDNQWFGTSGGNDTNDHIFLLSLEEVVQYFGDSGQLKNRPSNNTLCIDDKFNKKRIEYSSTSTWWLRSPGGNTHSAAYVHGSVYLGGDYGGVSAVGGVRPALWLNL